MDTRESDRDISVSDGKASGDLPYKILPPGAENAAVAALKAEELNSASEDEVTVNPAENSKKPKKQGKIKKKRNLWSVKITVVSLFLSAFISFLSELTASSEQIIVTLMLLLFLILASILFDGIGVAVTSCDITPIMAMASRKIYGAKTAMWLVKNNEKVANVCNDVIGDIFGIISGACTAAIVAKIIIMLGDGWQKWLTIGISSIVAALTIGGKAFLKNVAISNSKEFVMFVARIIAVFSPEERRRKRKQTEDKRKYAGDGRQVGSDKKVKPQGADDERDKNASKERNARKDGDKVSKNNTAVTTKKRNIKNAKEIGGKDDKNAP